MKHDPKGVKEKSDTFGLVSTVQPIPLFDKNSDWPHTFAKEVYDRRKKEIDTTATKYGFVLTCTSKNGNVTFINKKHL